MKEMWGKVIQGLIKSDDKIISIYDKGTTYLQHRGLIPLHHLKMFIECAFWSATIINNEHSVWIWFVTLCAAAGLFFSFITWQNAKNYWENARKINSLNAQVQRFRDNKAFRITMLFMVLLDSVAMHEIINISTGVLMLSIFYLQCCKFLGPGDYAKKKSDVWQGQRELG